MKVIAFQECCNKCADMYRDMLKNDYGIDADEICKTGVIDLSNKGLTSVPRWVFCFRSVLKCLKLNDNPDLGRLPQDIDQLFNLQCLEMQNCGIVVMPSTIYGLRRLVRIAVDNTTPKVEIKLNFCCNNIDNCGEKGEGYVVVTDETLVVEKLQDLKWDFKPNGCKCMLNKIPFTGTFANVLAEAYKRLQEWTNEKIDEIKKQNNLTDTAEDTQKATQILFNSVEYKRALIGFYMYALSGVIDTQFEDIMQEFSNEDKTVNTYYGSDAQLALYLDDIVAGTFFDGYTSWDPDNGCIHFTQVDATGETERCAYLHPTLNGGDIGTKEYFGEASAEDQIKKSLYYVFVRKFIKDIGIIDYNNITSVDEFFDYLNHRLNINFVRCDGSSVNGSANSTGYGTGEHTGCSITHTSDSNDTSDSKPCWFCSLINIILLELGGYTPTEFLQLSYDQLKLLSLKYLTINNAMLQDEFGNLGALTGLRYLDLARNKITSIPSFIQNFKSLEFLGLAYNDLIEIPYLDQLPNLKMLNLRRGPRNWWATAYNYYSIENSEIPINYLVDSEANVLYGTFIDVEANLFSYNEDYEYNAFNYNSIYYLHMKEVRGIKASYKIGHYADNATEFDLYRNPLPTKILKHLGDYHTNNNLIYLEFIIKETYTHTYEDLYDYLMKILAKQPNIQHIKLIGSISTEWREYFNPIHFQQVLGDKWKQIRSFTYEGLNYGGGGYESLYTEDELINFYEQSENLEYLKLGYNGNMYTLFDIFLNYSKQIRYYSYNCTDVFDYYRYEKEGDYLDYTSCSMHTVAKDRILNRIENDSSFVAPKGCDYDDYLYNRWQGTLVNGYPYKKWKYPPPFDKWSGYLPIGDPDD